MLNYYKVGGGVLATVGKVDGIEITAEEYETELQRVSANAETNAEAVYWRNVDYNEAVHTEIRKRYSDSQEFALLRQKEEKPEEYAAYFTYCELCKAAVREKRVWAAGE